MSDSKYPRSTSRPVLIVLSGHAGEHLDPPAIPGIDVVWVSNAHQAVKVATRAYNEGAPKVGLAGASVGGVAALDAWETWLGARAWSCHLACYAGVEFRRQLTERLLGRTAYSPLFSVVGRSDLHARATSWALHWRRAAALEPAACPQRRRIYPGGHGTVLRDPGAQADIRAFLAWTLLGGERPEWWT